MESPEIPLHASTIDLARPSAEMVDDNTTQRTATTPLTSPHDAVLAELQGEGTMNSNPKALPQNEASSPPREKSTNPYSGGLARPHFLSEFSLSSDPLFDPFTGGRIGDLVSTEDGSDPNTKTEEDIWSHLSQILKLQSDIAEKHIKMEGIGLKKPGPTPGNKSKGVNRRPGSSGGRVWGDGAEQGVDEGVEEEGEEEVESRKREEEFSRLNDKFAGRKDAIDGIMKDLDGLSSALTTFHALRTPVIDLSNSRSTTANTNTTAASPTKSASSPDQTLEPILSGMAPAKGPTTPGTQKRQLLSVLPLLEEARPSALSDSPRDMNPSELPNV